MNTEEYINFKKLNFDFDSLQIANISQNELSLIEEYIEFTRDVIEISQLFRIYRINYNNIFFHYDLLSNDVIIRNSELYCKEDDIILINTLIINYISSAKTFVDSANTFLEKKINHEKSSLSSDIYDNHFSYRFLYEMRNYSQHGHLLVNISSEKQCCFNIDHIIHSPHYNFKGKIVNELGNLKEIISDIITDDVPSIAFTSTLADFHICILQIYICFIDSIEDKLKALVDKISKMIKEHPDIVHNSEDLFNGYILYDVKEEYVHCFDPKENLIKLFTI